MLVPEVIFLHILSTELLYVDDLLLIAKFIGEFKWIFWAWNLKSRDLKINLTKTKVLVRMKTGPWYRQGNGFT